jgi:hypothetical protein
MAGIFLSYGSPDAAAVLKLRHRLEALGITVWEYKDDMPAGAPIHETVNAAINSARLAVVCFSDETAHREWITREVDWCFKAIADGDRETKKILPVWVGPHPENRIPALIAETSVFDLTDGTDAPLAKLALQVLEELGDEAPHVIPAALFSMTKMQCAELFDRWLAPGHRDDPAYQGLRSLCKTLGMANPPELFELLSQRYGDRPEDLAPFQSGKPLLDSTYEVLEKINVERIGRKRRPIVLRWAQDELGGVGKLSDEARDRWSSGDSLLIVDSISSFHWDVKERIKDVPAPLDPTRAAVLWIPPYTQILANFDEPLANTVHAVNPLGDLFRRVDKDPRRAIAFDTGTPMAFRLWLLRMFGGIPDAAIPLKGNVEAMKPRTGLGGFLNPGRP